MFNQTLSYVLCFFLVWKKFGDLIRKIYISIHKLQDGNQERDNFYNIFLIDIYI